MFPLVDLPDLFKMSKKRFEFFLENNPRQSTSFLFSVNINVVSLQLILIGHTIFFKGIALQ